MKRVMMKKHRNPLTTSSRFPNRRIWLKELISVFLNDFHTSLGSDHPRSSYKTAIAGLEVARDPTKYFTDQLCSACWIFLSVCEALFLHISQGPIASLVQIPVESESDSPWKNPNSRTADSSQASQASAPADRGTSYDPRFDRSHTQRGHGSMRGSPVLAQHPAHWRHQKSAPGGWIYSSSKGRLNSTELFYWLYIYDILYILYVSIYLSI